MLGRDSSCSRGSTPQQPRTAAAPRRSSHAPQQPRTAAAPRRSSPAPQQPRAAAAPRRSSPAPQQKKKETMNRDVAAVLRRAKVRGQTPRQRGKKGCEQVREVLRLQGSRK
eukprot:364987-Chlamydomonas_euryale.AAC.6